jgi:hypothetical protein
MSKAKIDAYIASAPDWQAGNLTSFRAAVHRAAPGVEEEWKWDVPVFTLNGRMVCAMSTFAKHTKYNFFEGASLDDADGLFNSGLESKRARSINLAEGEKVSGPKLAALLKRAFANASAG